MAKRDSSGTHASSNPDLAAAATGSQSAWDRLVDRYAQRVWSTARGLGLDAVAAAEVCHLTWARTVDHLERLSTDEQMLDWLRAGVEHEASLVRPLSPSSAESDELSHR
jgi:DNA-directed RNA polymerase specialized sigma24 family protein